ncbi:hypothetical protein FH972_023755 [Carpinus fangiana]|uniref:Uncharacterized protein n=1 Tax=Carpinus fangiana TaxID=176857 RepID=A0A5N6KYK6_9ROSI|nr:hypothetical protein FH972_023755 [Carpinus fangiana]
MSRQWTYGPRCGIDNCRSRKYAIGDDGFKYCSRGHQAEDQLIGDDDEWMGTAAKKTKLSTDDEAEKPPKYVQGREAIELFLQCYQLVLRKQVWWLVRERGFPPELESVTKDFWALKLQMLKHLLRDPDQAMRLFTSRSSSRASSRASSQPYSTSGSSDYDSDLNEAQSHLRSKHRRARALPRLIDSLGIIYVAALLLRLPVSIGDIRAWSLDPTFPYLRPIDVIPRAMIQTLPPTMLKTFEARSGSPDPGRIHTITIDIAASYAAAFTMDIPQISYALLLFKLVTSLGLPLDVFPFTHHLAQVLDLKHKMPDLQQNRVSLHMHPEVQLISLMCISVKLLYPFGSSPTSADLATFRYPRTNQEPASLSLTWDTWNNKQKDFVSVESSSAESGLIHTHNSQMLAVTEADVLRMTPSEMDVYMAWFRRTWLSHGDVSKDPDVTETSDFLKALWGMFPVEGDTATTMESPVERGSQKASKFTHTEGYSQGKMTQQFISAVQACLEPVPPRSDDEQSLVLRPGSKYVHYRKVQDIPEVGKPFFYAVARMAGLNVEQLVQAVFSIEMKIQKWTAAQRRTETMHEQSGDAQGEVGITSEPIYDPMSLEDENF